MTRASGSWWVALTKATAGMELQAVPPPPLLLSYTPRCWKRQTGEACILVAP